MKKLSEQDIIRAWKDEEYRDTFSEEELAKLPENPAGAMALPDSDLDAAAGGTWTSTVRYTKRAARYSRNRCTNYLASYDYCPRGKGFSRSGGRTGCVTAP